MYQTHCAKSCSGGTAESNNSSIDDSATHLCNNQGSGWEHGDEETEQTINVAAAAVERTEQAVNVAAAADEQTGQETMVAAATMTGREQTEMDRTSRQTVQAGQVASVAAADSIRRE